jgi:SAM-dependent methyltransferase
VAAYRAADAGELPPRPPGIGTGRKRDGTIRSPRSTANDTRSGYRYVGPQVDTMSSMNGALSRLARALPSRVADPLADVYFRSGTAWRLVTRKRSKFVSGYLAGLKGIEIGAASHNRFYLDALNVDRYASEDTVYKRQERSLALHAAHVDLVAPGDDLPFDDGSHDFVFSSHVIEHFPDPLKALYEWVRVARRYVVVIVPHRDRIFDADRPLSTVDELLGRHRNGFTSDEDRHWSVWTCESFVDMCQASGLRVIDHQDPDDKIGNGFTVVIDAVASQPIPAPL